MGVEKYMIRGRPFWKVDEWLSLADERVVRFRQRKIPTKEMALALIAKKRAEAFEGRFFERRREPTLTVGDVWALYQPVCERDNDSWLSDRGRWAHLARHLGSRRATRLTVRDVDEYRNLRLREKTKRGGPPAPSTLDKEVELLKRMLNYAVTCQKLETNPIAKASLLRRPNVRRTVVTDAMFEALHAAAEPLLRPILLTAYDTGMRLREVLGLRWDQVDLGERVVRLAAQDTKTEQARAVYLTGRVVAALRELPRPLRDAAGPVFVNPGSGEAWQDIRKMFRRACAGAELTGIWFHDLRRSFVTNARRRGIPESVVMRMSGHKTRAVFDRYNVVSEDDLRDAVRRLEKGSEKSWSRNGQSSDPAPKSENPGEGNSPGFSELTK
jgi:integrase